MYIQFQPREYVGIGRVITQVANDTTRNSDLKEAFLESVSSENAFCVTLDSDHEISLNILTIKKVSGSNGYMDFSAVAKYPPSFHKMERLGKNNLETVVHGIISFNV